VERGVGLELLPSPGDVRHCRGAGELMPQGARGLGGVGLPVTTKQVRVFVIRERTVVLFVLPGSVPNKTALCLSLGSS